MEDPKDSDRLEDLLADLAGDHNERSRRVAEVLAQRHNLKAGSQFLEATETTASREQLQRHLGPDLPPAFVVSLRMAVEDNRLVRRGFPSPPPGTKSRILFTAPHSLYLERKGHRPHAPEAYTNFLAAEFAKDVGGAYLAWSNKASNAPACR
eukprot:gnl/TRDRNA2_/TRDRNA2_167982_c0_seq1.p1 gnl/TRDRNA2_/TRDRNA2_167982_c0~~gnl/TRDRNA2_/TRDRNA2_167982_c0_seq1.p1  ORF type:complete len:152 (+),score=25.91 gnl/TRDRNA2_/TRDRNA2_167982_c0_seq1:117-572(+)